MQYIDKYKENNNGNFDVLLRNVSLDNKETLLIDNGIKVETDLRIHDPFKVTDKQRRKIFALCNDIEAHTGQPRDYMRYLFQEYVTVLYGYDKSISLSDCTRMQANQIIEVTLDWIFHNDIPLSYKTSDLLKQDKSFLYWSTVNRNCVICGKHGELAHHKAIGRGANRKKMEHYGYEVLCLCREHHQSQHDMGVESFDKLHHLENSWISVDERLNKMLKGEKK
ncbi:TPA: putative HNHc nuclease [Staphylococcus aureus]|nr:MULTISPECIES: putative HNHc nuclease [Staphylococcus]MCS5424815.1 putative HNHc nuclease [Staphylococcus aureus]MDG6500133.1 putative HNHc nuclease [Staphylococcus aureus]MDG6543501.1 putative HNHc nuclease [Staphylococcus aureus]MDG6546126.1 putative HNHc nuclease [Staphylococcus aureus]MDG6549001.1 putative HNHc nuclease [Staphylococcus aureus]